ncbi:ImmA/IrrE family metallo-endopeptidase [Paraliobacillus sp. X-1268]|uniref:ImmA/IrrE family metallo-endopeptidase n=1 Tax=Paraliobacillus sp. X-1268 TaxID=2213193 RepID=UPI00130030AA|nr:ImmA/IrrE family metallo-endopeptidase [Paraliobacillus sp. X-1268]
MYYNYTPFELEKWIEVFYKNIGITRPDDIDEQKIASALGISLDYSDRRSFSYEDRYDKLININNMLPKRIQRERFFHELGHILRHAGSQLIMPKSFIELQEFDSKRFTKYSALPYSMIFRYDLESNNISGQLAHDFGVSKELCVERVDNVRNKIFSKMILVMESNITY